MIDESTNRSQGIIRSIAYRPKDGDTMHEIDECRVLVLRGLELENRPPGKRSITLLSREAWSDTCRDLGADLPWWTRRANLLVEGLDLSTTIGLIVEVGSIRVRIHDETRPCKLMEEQFAGLRQALQPAYRGGVFGQVLVEGVIRAGDEIRLVTDCQPIVAAVQPAKPTDSP